MSKISILGCGWLGLPLAKSLSAKNHELKTSTTSPEKIEMLEDLKLHPYLITISDRIEGAISSFLHDAEILIVDIPPKLRNGKNENFIAKIKNLIPEIEKSSVSKVLFVSTTSVYDDDEIFRNITEETPENPETESGKQILEAEKLLFENTNFQTTSIRFGGLYGEDRHPVHYLSGKSGIANPEAPINLIGLKDCIGSIEKIIEKEAWNEVFNVVNPEHPSRKDYYNGKAKSLGLPLVEFNEEKISVGKIIDSSKLERLGYEFGAL